MEPDEFHGQGGVYEVKDGKRVLIAPPTQPHPEGDRARSADGEPIERPPAAPEVQPQSEGAQMDTGPGRRFAGPDLEPRSDY